MVQNKKTVTELKNELYVATLIEEHKKDKLWLTKSVKEKYDEACIKRFENARDMSNPQNEAFLSEVKESMMFSYKEKDLLLYLLLKFSIHHLEISKLTDVEKNFAEGLIISEFNHEMETTSLAIPVVVERLNSWYKTPGINHDFVVKYMEFYCNKGLNCFEPFSHFFDYSETLAYSMDELVIYKCLQSCAISFLPEEELRLLFIKSWCSSNYPCLLDEQNEEIVEKKTQSAISDFINSPKIRLVSNSEANTAKSQKSIFVQFTRDRQYDCILLPMEFLFAYDEPMSIDFIMDHVCDEGRVILYGRPSNSEYRKRIEKISRRIDFATFFSQQKLGEGMEIYIFKKGKTSNKVDVFYRYESDSYGGIDLIHEGMFNQVELTSDDLVALNYNMSKLEWIPRSHVRANERYLSLKDFLDASNEELIRMEQTDFGPVFSPDHYATSFDTFVVLPSSLREAQVDDKWKKISEPVLVIRENPFSVAYVEASADQPVFFKENALTFSVKKDVVDPKYLYLLSTNGKLEQVVKSCPRNYFEINDYELYKDEQNRIWVGYWPAKSLLLYKGMIAIPTIQAQREYCEIAEKAERNRIERAAMAQYRQDIHERKHALGQIMTQMRSTWESLLLSKNEHNGYLDDDFVYGKKHPHTVKQLFETVDSFMKEMDEGIENFTPEDRGDFHTKEKIVLFDYLENFIKKHSNPCFELQLDLNSKAETKGIIYFSKNALDTILQNLIFNAWKHGFKGKDSDNLIRFTIKEDEDSIILFVSNNGSPLAANMENGVLFKYGQTSARGQESVDGHHHHGLGCHQIWCLMRDKGQGDVECISEPNKDFPVTFKLSFHK